MSRRLRTLLAFTVILAAAGTIFADESPRLSGERLYRNAITADGAALRAVAHLDVALPPGASACVNCHRRSGIGIAEGGKRSLNITAPALFQPSTRPPLRPAYDDQTLLRAIVAGIDAGGRLLDATMPRYALNPDDGAALIAYLKTLGAAEPDGVSPTELQIATIVSSSAPTKERDAVAQVLERFVSAKNAETRLEARRAAASNRNYYGRSRQRAYREWVLHTWTLDGPADDWEHQLDVQYDATRPFAVLSGAVGDAGPAVHDFCERKSIPCIFPLTDNVTDTDGDFYSLYFSAGAGLQASITAAAILRDANVVRSALVVYERGPTGEAAVHAFTKLLRAGHGIDVSSVSFARGRPPSGTEWRRLLDANDADVLVFWLPANVLAGLVASMRDASRLPARIYTAEFASDWAATPASSDALVARLRHVYPYSIARAGGSQLPREHLWLQQHGLDGVDEIAAAKVLYAARMLGMVLADIQSNFSREYLLETFEHALDGTQLTSLFPRTSLGPGQRLLTRGANVVRVRADRDAPYADAVWIQP